MSYINYAHRADIYSKSTTTSPAGQRVANWSLESSSVKCAYIPKVSDLRNRNVDNTFTTDQIISMFFPPNAGIDFNVRIQNISDQFGNIIDEGPIEISSIVKAPALNGKIHHIEVAGYRVQER